MEDVLILASGFLVLWSMVHLAVIAWITYKYLDLIEGSMPNSKIIQDNKRLFSGWGLRWGMHRAGMAASVLAFPRFYFKRGLVDLSEVDAFPRWLRRRLLFNVSAFYATLTLWVILFQVSDYIYSSK